jgi:hypothetical protein
LDRACLSGHEDIALFLVDRGAKFDMFSKSGMTVMDKSNLPKTFWEQMLVLVALNSALIFVQGKKPAPTEVEEPPKVARATSPKPHVSIISAFDEHTSGSSCSHTGSR